MAPADGDARAPLRVTYPTLQSDLSVKRDYYEVLGIDRHASPDDVKKAYRRLAMQFHPDRNPGDAASEERFKEATEAYTVLADPDARRRYDRSGFSQQTGFEPADFGSVGDILEGLFGAVFRGGARKARVGRDLKYELSLDFVEAALGASKSVRIDRPAPCDTCAGSGAEPGTHVSTCDACGGRGEVRTQRGLFSASRPCAACNGRGQRIVTPCRACRGDGSRVRTDTMEVRVPPGVEDGAVRTVRGGGEIAPGGAGELHVTIRVQPHPLFTREGPDVRCTVPVSFPQATLGATIEIPTLEGKVQMKVPPGTQSGKLFRLRGKGIPLYGGAGRGDQLVTIVVEIPTRLSRHQKKLVEDLAAEMGIEAQPEQASFLEKLRSLFD